MQLLDDRKETRGYWKLKEKHCITLGGEQWWKENFPPQMNPSAWPP
jgi:hypothetical protein